MGKKRVAETTGTEAPVQAAEEITVALPKVKKGPAKPPRIRGRRYQKAASQIDRKKTYPLSEAIKLLKNISISCFAGSVDAHLVIRKSPLKGEVKFPHPTGKKQTIRIADENLLSELEAGKINFTSLITTPAMMPKLTKYARLLGPRGLMPNPKTGTITDKPEEMVKKISRKIQFKTEAKAPLIHLTIGKIGDLEKNLEENFKALIEAIGRKNIQKTVLAPTMGPGIKVNLNL